MLSLAALESRAGPGTAFMKSSSVFIGLLEYLTSYREICSAIEAVETKLKSTWSKFLFSATRLEMGGGIGQVASGENSTITWKAFPLTVAVLRRLAPEPFSFVEMV